MKARSSVLSGEWQEALSLPHNAATNISLVVLLRSFKPRQELPKTFLKRRGCAAHLLGRTKAPVPAVATSREASAGEDQTGQACTGDGAGNAGNGCGEESGYAIEILLRPNR